MVSTSLLQNCCGPQFEKLLAEFSTRALFKKLVSDEEDGSTIKRLLGYQDLCKKDQTQGLSLAYKHALVSQLKERGALERRWRKFGRALNSAADLVQAEEDRASGSPKKDKKLPKRTVDRVHEHVRANWEGDNQWVDIVVSGASGRSNFGILDGSFSDVWKHASQDALYSIRTRDTEDLLHDLEDRVHVQSSRLEKWKLMRESPSEAAETVTTAQPQAPHSSSEAWDSPRAPRNPTSELREPKHSRPAESRIAKASRGGINDRRTTGGPMTRSKSERQCEIERPPAALKTERKGRTYHLRSRTAENLKYPALHEETDAQLSPFRGKDNSPSLVGHVDALGSGDQIEDTGHDPSLTKEPVRAVPESKPMLSLAERTRMSMARSSPLKRDPVAVSEPLDSWTQIDMPPSTKDVGAVAPLHTTVPFESLADRARQSMNLMTAKTPAQKRPRKARTSSLNETRRAGAGKYSQPAEDLTDTTWLEETLQNMDADYEAVFKSRPRVALSPVLSPRSGGPGIHEVLNLNGHISGEEDDFS